MAEGLLTSSAVEFLGVDPSRCLRVPRQSARCGSLPQSQVSSPSSGGRRTETSRGFLESQTPPCGSRQHSTALAVSDSVGMPRIWLICCGSTALNTRWPSGDKCCKFLPQQPHLGRIFTLNMGFFSKVKPNSTSVRIQKPPKGKFFFAGRTWDRVKWYQSSRMRVLYFYCVVLILNNVANGFDGSMMNGLQVSLRCVSSHALGLTLTVAFILARLLWRSARSPSGYIVLHHDPGVSFWIGLHSPHL